MISRSAKELFQALNSLIENGRDVGGMGLSKNKKIKY
jgi:hypothetical protein